MHVKRAFGFLLGAALSLGAPVIASAAPAAAAGTCPAGYVIAIPGTWETTSDADVSTSHGTLAGVTDGLSSRIKVEYVPYAASAFPWEGEVYGNSKAEAVGRGGAMLKAMADACPATKLGIIGYSQGADAAGDIAWTIGAGNGPVDASRVAAVGLLSDPRRGAGDPQVGIVPAPGTGAVAPRSGGFGAVTGAVRSICAPTDLYCAAPPTDLVAKVAGFGVLVSGDILSENPQPLRHVAEGAALAGDILGAGGMDAMSSQIQPDANDLRVAEFNGFVQSQSHQDYWKYPVDTSGTSAITWLHNWLGTTLR